MQMKETNTTQNAPTKQNQNYYHMLEPFYIVQTASLIFQKYIQK